MFPIHVALIAVQLADRYGRRMFLWLHSIVFLVAGLLEAFCPNLPSPWAWLIVARVLIGFAAGGASVGASRVYMLRSRRLLGIPDPAHGWRWPRVFAVVPLYIGEVAPQSQRGALTSLNQFAVTVAILISEVRTCTRVTTFDACPDRAFATPCTLCAMWQIAGQFISNNPGWRYLLGGTAAVAVVQLITAPFLPESPK